MGPNANLPERVEESMRLLVLGGTVFVGRAFVEAALDRGHEITLFHRGARGADLFPQVERVHGDRDGGLDALTGSWDAVVDTCGYLPRVVRQSAQRLQAMAPRYLFVSTISVYAEPTPPGSDESAPLIELADPTVEDIPAYYGGLKVLCEREVTAAYGDDAVLIRPGLIAGPHDPTNRFTYWAYRATQPGEILALDRRAQPMQLIDARDLAAFMVKALEEGLSGAFNTAGPDGTYGDMLAACGAKDLRWVSSAFLEEHEVNLPLLLPSDGSEDGLLQVSSAKAISAGLTYRPLAETAADTVRWRSSVETYDDRGFGLSAEREKELLQLA